MELPLIQPLQHAVLAAFFMPWNLAVRGLSWACALQIHALTMLTGATPEGYVQQSKVVLGAGLRALRSPLIPEVL